MQTLRQKGEADFQAWNKCFFYSVLFFCLGNNFNNAMESGSTIQDDAVPLFAPLNITNCIVVEKAQFLCQSAGHTLHQASHDGRYASGLTIVAAALQRLR